MDKTIVVVAKTKTQFEDYIKNRTGSKEISCGTGYYSGKVTFYGPERQDYIQIGPNAIGETLRGLSIDELVMLTPLNNEAYNTIIVPCMIASQYREPDKKTRETQEVVRLLNELKIHFEKMLQ